MDQPDICIVGAGPAGTYAALKLSYLGIPCQLIDKATFPRDKICGDALSGKVPLLLDRLDPSILTRFIHNFQPVDSWGVRFFPPTGRLIELPFSPGYNKSTDQAPGYVSKRLDFDYFMVQEVERRSNIDFRTSIQITNYERTASGWKIRSADGTFESHCKLLLVADGAHSQFSRKQAGLQVDASHHAAAVRAYYSGVTGFHDDNFIELHFLKELNPGYFWLFKLPNGLANVGLGVRSDIVSKRRLNLRELMPVVIENNPAIRQRFAHARLEGKITGYGLPLGSKERLLSGDHFLLLGDAGHLIDPLTGEGIGNAFYSGWIAAELAAKALADSRFDAAYLRAYDVRIERVLRSEMRLSYRLQRLMENTWLANPITTFIANHPGMVDILCRMYTDFDYRKQIVNPLFWLNMWFKKRNFRHISH